jgi:xanthine dehydrogenase YagS FAD-binding subunit
MRTFEWSAPKTLDEAVRLLGAGAKVKDPDERPQLLAGGQDLLTSMKEGIVRPPQVINLKSVPGLGTLTDQGPKGLRIGALVTIADLAENKVVRASYPGIAEAAKAIASPQIQNLPPGARRLPQEGRRHLLLGGRREQVQRDLRRGAVVHRAPVGPGTDARRPRGHDHDLRAQG